MHQLQNQLGWFGASELIPSLDSCTRAPALQDERETLRQQLADGEAQLRAAHSALRALEGKLPALQAELRAEQGRRQVAEQEAQQARQQEAQLAARLREPSAAAAASASGVPAGSSGEVSSEGSLLLLHILQELAALRADVQRQQLQWQQVQLVEHEARLGHTQPVHAAATPQHAPQARAAALAQEHQPSLQSASIEPGVQPASACEAGPGMPSVPAAQHTARRGAQALLARQQPSTESSQLQRGHQHDFFVASRQPEPNVVQARIGPVRCAGVLCMVQGQLEPWWRCLGRGALPVVLRSPFRLETLPCRHRSMAHSQPALAEVRSWLLQHGQQEQQGQREQQGQQQGQVHQVLQRHQQPTSLPAAITETGIATLRQQQHCEQLALQQQWYLQQKAPIRPAAGQPGYCLPTQSSCARAPQPGIRARPSSAGSAQGGDAHRGTAPLRPASPPRRPLHEPRPPALSVPRPTSARRQLMQPPRSPQRWDYRPAWSMAPGEGRLLKVDDLPAAAAAARSRQQVGQGSPRCQLCLDSARAYADCCSNSGCPVPSL